VSPEETHAATRKVCDALIDAPALNEKSLKVTLALALAEAKATRVKSACVKRSRFNTLLRTCSSIIMFLLEYRFIPLRKTIKYNHVITMGTE
jgi:hypothetical protein